MLFEAGSRVPADLRLIEARGLLIEEAILTGESVPAEKRTRAVSAHAPLGDRTSMAFSGTLVAAGHGVLEIKDGKFDYVASVAPDPQSGQLKVRRTSK